MLKRLKSEGITILVSTPYMDEATMCERIALIQDGHILSINSPQGIMANYPDDLFAIKSDHMGTLLKDLRQHPQVKSAFSFGEYHHITMKADFDYSESRLPFINSLAHSHVEIRPISPTVEDCFIQLMKNDEG